MWIHNYLAFVSYFVLPLLLAIYAISLQKALLYYIFTFYAEYDLPD